MPDIAGNLPVETAQPTPRKRHAKSQRRWELIIEASTALFKERGFAATSMQDISDRVGLQKGSLYYYVDSKEMLLFEILRDLHRGGEALVDHINFETGDPLGELRSYFVQISIYSGRHADRLGIFTRDFQFLDQAQQSEIIRERFMYRHATERLIALAKERGQVSDLLDVHTAAQTVLRAVTAVFEWYRPDGPLSIEEIAVQNAAILVQGLAAFGRT
ncbi:TetR/AcrR family transcriptional regulator [Parablastomonas sp. CN1-191]|uniref:TetR/AcrR family transcriptional regulator n=1 Tax=Parablastomonas sp. CN1-191 TaxID=3400908 RepID=UPI003BF8E782